MGWGGSFLNTNYKVGRAWKSAKEVLPSSTRLQTVGGRVVSHGLMSDIHYHSLHPIAWSPPRQRCAAGGGRGSEVRVKDAFELEANNWESRWALNQ